MVRFQALGGLDLRGHDGRELLSVLAQSKRQALLSYLAIASPRGYQVPYALVEDARETAKKRGAVITSTEDPAEALRDADAVYCDVWLSMGHSDAERAQRNAALAPYQVNAQAMRLAKRDAVFMHCLPAHRGEEVTADVADGPQSVIFDQAENRLWSAMAILYGLIENKLEGSRRVKD